MAVPPIVKKLSLFIGILAVVLCIPAAWIWYMFAGPGYYAEFNDIKETLEGLPDVELIRAGGNKDITFEDIEAEIRVKDKGRIAFVGLTRDSFKSAPDIRLYAIGPYEFGYRGKGYIGVRMTATGEPVRSDFTGFAINIGSEGKFSRFFPFQIRTVQDVIARYDDICSVLASWPAAPERGRFTDEEGTEYYFSVKINPAKPKA